MTTEENYLVKPTLDGEVLVRKEGDSLKEDALRTVPLGPLPSFIGERHEKAMATFHAALVNLKESQSQRKVPMMRNELLDLGFNKKLYRQLIDAGLLCEKLISLVRESDQKSTGARAAVFYTPQGRAYIRAHVDSGYALTDNT